MKRILFVDDEPRVLDGLRDLFRKQRREWDMVFAPGGPEALTALDDGTYDVIVCDMRMPVVDGNGVLTRARECQPSAARIILSGFAGRDAETAALTVAHQFVSKPADPGRLRAVIERACALPALLADPALRRLTGRLDRLPSPPSLYLALTRATARADVTMAELAAVVEQDPAMAAKVLQLVNSALFGTRAPQTSVHQALVYLGVQRLKALTLTAHIFLQGRAGATGLDLDEQQRHAAAVAQLAQQFVREPGRAETVFTAGLLHEVGKLIIAMAEPAMAADIERDAQAESRPAYELEQERLGTTHADAGAYLLALWGLPLEIVDAVRCHHRPAESPTDAVVAVHVADALLLEARDGGRGAGRWLHADVLAGTAFADDLPRWRAMAQAFHVQ